MAAENALSYGIDYSNGGCFWDGYDLKVNGKNSYRYRKGFRYVNPSHDILAAPEPIHVSKKGEKGTFYDTVFISTAAYGKTIFWKLDENYLKARGAVQCQ